MEEVEELQTSYFGKVSTYEVLYPENEGKLFFDQELYRQLQPNQDEINDVLAQALDKFKIMMEPLDFFEPSTEVSVDECHGWVVKDGEQVFKISFHYIFVNYKVKMKDGIKILKHFGHLFPTTDGWDWGVYPQQGERLMRMVGSFKNPKDKRILRPCTSRLVEPKPFHNHVIQYLIGAESDLLQVLGLRETGSTNATRRRVSILPMTEHEPPSWLTLTPKEMVLEALKALQSEGLVEGFSAAKVNYTDSFAEVYFKNEDGRTCLSGPYVHDNNNFVVRFKSDGTLAYYCFSTQPGCRTEVFIGRWQGDISHMFRWVILHINQ